MAEHLTIPGALEWDAVERHSIATLRYAGGKEHDVKYVSEVAYDALKQRLRVAEQLLCEWRHGRDMTLKDCASLRDRTDFVLNPVPETARCMKCDNSTVEQCDDSGCGFLGSGNGAPDEERCFHCGNPGGQCCTTSDPGV